MSRTMGLEFDFQKLLDAAKGEALKQVALSPEVQQAAKEAASEKASMTIGDTIIKYWPVAVGVGALSVFGLMKVFSKK